MNDIVIWPEGVAKLAGLSAPALNRERARGNHPKLYAVTERCLVTTKEDLLEWIRAKAVPPGYKCREAVTRGKGKGSRSLGSVFDSDLDD